MSFAEVLNELPALTLEQRQQLIRQAVELDGTPLSPGDEALVERRLAAHHADPVSSLPMEEVKARIRSRFTK
jgi:putative addiction module component (TIGR02574 family)